MRLNVPTVLIDNVFFLFFCVTVIVQVTSRPFLCNDMGYLQCTTTVSVWTLGMAGECIDDHAGFRLGQGSARKIMLQVILTIITLDRGFYLLLLTSVGGSYRHLLLNGWR